jgi:hypothetical protein
LNHVCGVCTKILWWVKPRLTTLLQGSDHLTSVATITSMFYLVFSDITVGICKQLVILTDLILCWFGYFGCRSSEAVTAKRNPYVDSAVTRKTEQMRSSFAEPDQSKRILNAVKAPS